MVWRLKLSLKYLAISRYIPACGPVAGVETKSYTYSL